MNPSGRFRFQIALSFPGEFRDRVLRVAEALAVIVGQDRVLYDQWHRAEFARPNLDVYLPKLYHEQSCLLVFFLCGQYVQKEWCGLEWRAGRDLHKKGEDERLMFLRLDDADVPGLYSIDGYLDISGLPDDVVSSEILKRLELTTARSENPSESSDGSAVTGAGKRSDPKEFWEQRRRLPETIILKEIWSKARWHIWICPTEFRRARFQSVEQCRDFMQSSYVRSRDISILTLRAI
ncbi:MAG: TIR domain-containing protein [Acidobacteriota bacterium]|nr:TIR domain-containing protein [Acidobacteriota bacterium]